MRRPWRPAYARQMGIHTAPVDWGRLRSVGLLGERVKVFGWIMLGVGILSAILLCAYEPYAILLVLALMVVVWLAVIKPRSFPSFLLGFAILASSGFGTTLIGDVDEPVYVWHRIAVAVVAVMLSVFSFPKTISSFQSHRLLSVWLMWCGLSIAWADDLLVAAITFVSMFGAYLLGIVLFAYKPKAGGMLIRRTLVTGLVISLIAGVALPAYSFIRTYRPEQMATVERFVGLWPWNSDLGMVAGLVLVLTVALWSRRRWLVGSMLLVLSFGVIVASESATSVTATAAGVLALLWMRSPKNRVLLTVLLLVGALLFRVANISSPSEWALGLLGRSADLTGRSYIWEVSWGFINERPMMGYGIGSAPDFTPALGFASHAHSGYLQVLLETGWVGLTLLLATIVAAMIYMIRKNMWQHFGILVFILVANYVNNYFMVAGLILVVLAWLIVAESNGKSTLAEGKLFAAPDAISDGRSENRLNEIP